MNTPPDKSLPKDPAEHAVDTPIAPSERPGAAGDDTYVARVARGAGISTAGQGIGRVLGYVTQIAISQLFGVAVLGFYAAGIAVVNGAQILSRFGMENGVVRYVAHYRAQDDTSRMKGTIMLAIGITFAVSLVVSGVMFFGADFVVNNLPTDKFPAEVLRAFAVTLPFFVFMSMVLWATQGFQTVTYAAIVQQIVRPALFLVFVVVFYLLSASVVGVIAAYGVSMLLGGLAGVYFLVRLFPPLLDRSVSPKFEAKALFTVSIPLSIAQGARYLNTWSAVLILSAFAAGAPVGVFNAAARTATQSTIVRFAFSGIFSPIISSAYARGELGTLGRLYKDVSRWIFTGAFPIFLVILVLGHEVLALFGEKVASEGFVALIVVAVAQLFSASVGTTPRMLAMTGNQNIEMVATTAAAIIGVGVSLALVPSFGILGAAIGMSTAIVTENAGTMAAVKWRLGFFPYSSEWIKPLAAGAISGVATYLLGLVLPIPGAIPTIIVLGGFLCAAFLALLLLFGLSETDREFLGAFRAVARRYLPNGSRNARGDDE